jgi:hypothetical protein
MTDEERWKLCEDLREYHMADCQKAADEIKRLVQERDSALAALRTTQKQYEEMGERALVAERPAALAQSNAPPRPDTSTGLIEAAGRLADEIELTEEHGAARFEAFCAICRAIKDVRREIAALCARAADRSGPADYIPIGGAGNGA